MKIESRQSHAYHQVDVSPWPLQMAISVMGFAFSLVSFLNHKDISQLPSQISIVLISYLWWRDVVRESKGGYHTKLVQKGIQIGFLQFLISEIMLFASFFWAFFHSSQAPAIEIGSTWPPVGINPVNTWAIPLLGSSVLLASGFVQTLSHHATIAGKKSQAILTLFVTIQMGGFFQFQQSNEYYYGEFTIADSVFGSVFYCTTGLHAQHVIVGVIFQTVSLIRKQRDEYTSEHHQGYEFAIYYWHLVDVVWLQVFAIYYFWSDNK